MKTKFLDQQTRINLQDLEQKYHCLTWLGRRKPSDFDDPNKMQTIAWIVDQFPEESMCLATPPANHFYYGFYTAALAYLRYILTSNYGGVAVANDSFPELEIFE